jgi:hypothetical protein
MAGLSYNPFGDMQIDNSVFMGSSTNNGGNAGSRLDVSDYPENPELPDTRLSISETPATLFFLPTCNNFVACAH